MANKFVGWRDGGKTDQEGLSRWLKNLFAEGPILSTSTAMKVVQRAAGANMSVDVSIGDTVIHKLGYAYYGWNDDAINCVISAADATNPRYDIVVAYIDLSVVSSASVNNPDAILFKAVAGTPAGSPADPSAGTIQTSVGAGNPYVKLARVTVAALDTAISDSEITDIRIAASIKAPQTRLITALSADTTGAFAHDFLSVSASGAARTYTLPDAALASGRMMTIIKSDATENTVTVARTSSQTINGSTGTLAIRRQNDFVTVISDGSNWLLVPGSALNRGFDKTGAYTLTDLDETINASTAGGAFTLTLPTAVGRRGKRFTINKAESGTVNNLTIATTSSQTIDGVTTHTMVGYASITVESDGANWQLVGATAEWSSYATSWTTAGTTPAIGNGTLTSYVRKIGRRVEQTLALLAGTTTTFGNSTQRFGIPVGINTTLVTLDVAGLYGSLNVEDAGVSFSIVFPYWSSSNGLSVSFMSTAGATLTNTSPATWGNTDKFKGMWAYPSIT